jgi:hypothetical protein
MIIGKTKRVKRRTVCKLEVNMGVGVGPHYDGDLPGRRPLLGGLLLLLSLDLSVEINDLLVQLSDSLEILTTLLNKALKKGTHLSGRDVLAAQRFRISDEEVRLVVPHSLFA